MGSSVWKPTKEKGKEHGENDSDQPPQDLLPNEATLGTCAPKPHPLHPDEDDGLESREVNSQTIEEERAGQQIQRAQRAQHGKEEVCQPENGLSNPWMEASKTEVALIEIAIKRVEEPGHALGLSAPLSVEPVEIRGINLIEAISPPIDEDWVIVGDNDNPGAPLLGRTPSGASAGEPQPNFLSSHTVELALASLPTGCPYPIAQAHRSQPSSLLSKQVASEGALPGGTEVSQEVGAYTAHNNPPDVVEYAHKNTADVVEYQNFRKASGEHRDRIVNHLQHVASNSPNLRRVMPEKMGTRPRNACELRFSSLHAISNIPEQQPKYSNKSNVGSDSRLAHTRLLFPGE